MKTLEYRFVDKSKWPPGPWHDEPDKVQWLDPVTSLPCMVRRGGGGGWCGYVGVPKSHPLFEKDYEKPDVSVHGGLTFANVCSGDEQGICHLVEPGEDDNIWWFGFDCSHYGDLRPGDPFQFSDRENQYRDLEYVKAQTLDLARQLKEAA